MPHDFPRVPRRQPRPVAIRRISLSSNGLIVWSSLYFAFFGNGPFFASATAGRPWSEPSTWLYAGATLVALVAVNSTLLALLVHRSYARLAIGGLIVVTAVANFYMQRYGVVMDPTMLRNAFHTDGPEALELLGWGLALHVLIFAGPPLLALGMIQVPPDGAWKSVLRRMVLLLVSAAVLLASVFIIFQDVSALMRNKKEMRYQITPANVIYSSVRSFTSESQSATRSRVSVGRDAHLSPAWQQRVKPALMVIVVGETVRAANWGLNGYERQTTPQLAALGVVNFPDVTACGTNTETSLPCMFSAVGRRRYDEARIRGSESLLNVLEHAGWHVVWLDNQSGCKGVCDGVTTRRMDVSVGPDLCGPERCLDEVLVRGLDEVARDAQTNTVVVLHMLGNHGPSYHARYPASMDVFKPACETGELHKCDTAAIVNAYDNAVLYADHVLALTIQHLKQQSSRFDTALLYLSDHGESLGEHGIFLHGLPYAMAPAVQTRIPMVWWLSPEFRSASRLNQDCLVGTTHQSWSHDNLFHSVLGLLQTQTNVYEPELDISAGCRP